MVTAEELEEVKQSFRRASYEAELEAARATAKRPKISAMGGIWAGYLGRPRDQRPRRRDRGRPGDAAGDLACA